MYIQIWLKLYASSCPAFVPQDGTTACDIVPPANMEGWQLGDRLATATAHANAWPPGSHVTRTNPSVTTQLAPSSPTSYDSAQESAREEEATEEYVYCGCDLKPVLPPALAVSVVVRSICFASVQMDLAPGRESFGRPRSWREGHNRGPDGVLLFGRPQETTNIPVDSIDLWQGAPLSMQPADTCSKTGDFVEELCVVHCTIRDHLT